MTIVAPTNIHNALPPGRVQLTLRAQPGVVFMVLNRSRLGILNPLLAAAAIPRPLPRLRTGVGAVPLSTFLGPIYQSGAGNSLKGQQYP